MNAFFISLLMILIATIVSGFYIPGVAPVEFSKGDRIEVKAVKMTSARTQLPYEYYSLPFCIPPNKTLHYTSENLGEVLRGDRIVNTAYEVQMAEDIQCRLLCGTPNTPLYWSVSEQDLVASRIEHEYFVHLLVDNLPCVTRVTIPGTTDYLVEHGYRLGFSKDNKLYINNHLKLILLFHQTSDEDTYRVVGFEVEAYSIHHKELKFSNEKSLLCEFPQDTVLRPQEVRSDNNGQLKLYFTYSVTWKFSEISWASRWDAYLAMTDVKIHWFSIINSIAVTFFLTGLVATIIVSTLRRDIARYNSDIMMDEVIEQSGWKLVHGDVFRSPRFPELFITIIGSGLQIFLMSLVTILFAVLGMLSPSKRGALMTCAIFFYAISGLASGYISARLYKTIRGRYWTKAAIMTATLYPGIVFGMCFFLNLFIWNKSSSGAVPFSTMLSLLLIWFGISVPLVYIGYQSGYRKPCIHISVHVNQIPRQIPPQQKWYMNPIICVFGAGVLPFGAVYIELFFIFTAIWQNQFYYLFGFLFLVFIILIMSCALISIIMVYFQLCAEDYNWWWKSLLFSGASSIYVALYGIYYFYNKLQITEVVPVLLYFSYTIIMVLTYWLLTATVGFFGTYAFIKEIYSAIKLD